MAGYRQRAIGRRWMARETGNTRVWLPSDVPVREQWGRETCAETENWQSFANSLDRGDAAVGGTCTR